MKVGLSTYSLSNAYRAGQVDFPGIIDWIAANGGEHVEIVPLGLNLVEDKEMVAEIVKRADAAGLEISSYTIGANFIQPDSAAVQAEVARLKSEVEVGAALGVRFMRHDAGTRPVSETGSERFEQDFPILVESCREVAAHARQFGITTSVENHGFHLQASERVRRLVIAVDHDNFRTTVDVGNFMCVDEIPLEAVRRNIPYASMVHIKDFYRRPAAADPGKEGWFNSAGGSWVRGAIAGHGDIGLPEIIRLIRNSGFDGYLSVEFEGMEDCFLGSRLGMANTRRYWNAAG